MATKYRSRKPRQRTRYEWRWADEFASESRVIPDSWVQNGEVEAAADDEEQFFAVKVMTGLFFEYEISDGNAIVSGPHRERQGMLVGYTNESCNNIVIRSIINENKWGDTIKPPDDFRCIIGVHEGQILRYDDMDESISRVLEDKYSSEVGQA